MDSKHDRKIWIVDGRSNVASQTMPLSEDGSRLSE